MEKMTASKSKCSRFANDGKMACARALCQRESNQLTLFEAIAEYLKVYPNWGNGRLKPAETAKNNILWTAYDLKRKGQKVTLRFGGKAEKVIPAATLSFEAAGTPTENSMRIISNSLSA